MFYRFELHIEIGGNIASKPWFTSKIALIGSFRINLVAAGELESPKLAQNLVRVATLSLDIVILTPNTDCRVIFLLPA